MDGGVSADRGGVAAGRDVVAQLISTGDHATFFIGAYQALDEVFIDPSEVFDRVRIDRCLKRDWLEAEVDRFLEGNDRGYFVLQAQPGLGKTTFLAQLVRQRGWIHHFVELAPGEAGIVPARKNLAAQVMLAFELGAAGRLALPDEAASRPDFLRNLLRQAAGRRRKGERIVVVVDGLDEAGTRPGENVLGLPRVLPAGVFFLVSTQPVPIALTAEGPRRALFLVAESRENLADVRRYLAQAVDWKDLVDSLVDKSHGLWVYLHYVLEEIEQGAHPVDLDALPEGLWRYYAGFWQRWRREHEAEWYASHLPLLAALAAVQEDASLGFLCALSAVEQRPEPELRGLFQGRWRPFLAVRKGEERRYRPYHGSFRDFLHGRFERGELREDEADFAEDLAVATRRAHARIAERYTDAWGGLENGLPGLYEPSQRDLDEGYGLRHLPLHLVEAGQRTALYALIGKAWMEAQLARTRAPFAYARDVELAIESARSARPVDLVQEIRCSFIYATFASLASSIPPQILGLLAGLGQVDRAEGYAALLGDPQARSGGYCQIAAALLRRNDQEGAVTVLERALAAAELVPQPAREVVLAEVTAILAEAGEDDRAAELADRVLRGTRKDAHREDRPETLARIAVVLARSGQIDRALAAVEEITDDNFGAQRARALAEVVRAQVEAGRTEQALAAAQQAGDPWHHVPVLVELVKAAVAANPPQLERAVEAAGRALREAESTGKDQWYRAPLLAHAAKALIAAGQVHRAEEVAARAVELASSVEDRGDGAWALAGGRAWALAGVAGTLAQAGQLHRAAAALDAIGDPPGPGAAAPLAEVRAKVSALPELASALAAAGEGRQALALAAEAEGLAMVSHAGGGIPVDWTLPGIEELDARWRTTTPTADVTVMLAAAGHVDQARAALDQTGEPEKRAALGNAVATALAKAGNADQALAVADATQPSVSALTETAAALVRAGRHEQARSTADRALAMAMAEATQPDMTLFIRIARALAKATSVEWLTGLTDWAMKTVQRLQPSSDGFHPLAGLAPALVEAGLPDLAVTVTELLQQQGAARCLPEAVNVLAAAGRAEQAVRVADRIHPLTRSSQVSGEPGDFLLPGVVRTLARAGRPDEARRLIGKALSEAEAGGDPGLVAATRARAAEALILLGEPDEAAETAVAVGNPWYGAPVLALAAEALMRAGNPRRAQVVAEQATAAARSMGNSWATGSTMARVVEVLVRCGLVDVAWAAVDAVGTGTDKVTTLIAVAIGLADAGRAEQAAEVAEEAVRQAERVHDAGLRAAALAETGKALARTGRSDLLSSVIARAVDAAQAVEYEDLRVSALADVAEALIGMEEIDWGVAVATEIDISRCPRPSFKVHALLAGAAALTHAGQRAKAAEVAERTFQILEREAAVWPPEDRADDLTDVALALAAAGEAERALLVWRTALEAARHAGRSSLLSVLGQGIQIAFDLDAGATLWRLCQALFNVYGWWPPASARARPAPARR